MFRTRRIGWAEVSRFTDGTVGGYGPDGGGWALTVVLHDGRTVTGAGTAAMRPPSKTLLAIVQAAQRYDIPADLTGTIERGSFPATLLGASGTITATICDGHLAEPGRETILEEAILEVVQRTEPVQPGDILALGHDGGEVEILAVRQVIAGGCWEQVAYAYRLLPGQPGTPGLELDSSGVPVQHRPAAGRESLLAAGSVIFGGVSVWLSIMNNRAKLPGSVVALDVLSVLFSFGMWLLLVRESKGRPFIERKEKLARVIPLAASVGVVLALVGIAILFHLSAGGGDGA